MTLSVLLNVALVISACVSVWRHTHHASIWNLLRYFTILSNLFCALSALLMIVYYLSGGIGYIAMAIKYIATVSVTVTMLTVVAFLGPTLGYRLMYSGPDLWLHLLCPLLALGTYFIWDHMEMSGVFVLLGVVPVALYGALYLNRVVFTDGEKAWEDFYGFNKGGKWWISLTLMLLATLLISLALWALI